MASGGYRAGAGRKPLTEDQRAKARERRAAAMGKPAVTVMPPKAQATTAPAEPKKEPNLAAMLPEVLELSKRYSRKVERTPENNPFRLPAFPKPLIDALAAAKLPQMAMDDALAANLTSSAQGWLAGPALDSLPGEGLLFLGYTYLAELAQRPEYRVMAETIADDATREWIDFDVVGDEKEQKEEEAKDPEGFKERMDDPDERKKRVEQAGKTDRVKALKDDQLRLEVQARFYEQCRNDGFFGRSHLFLDVRTNGDMDDDIPLDELKADVGDSRDAMSKAKVPQGSFKAMRTIEPVWTYPLMYNALNPLRKDWYNPQVWFVMGREIHGSRLQTFVGHPVPDMLKPAYSFGGLSLSQLAKPYVDIWLQTRSSVAQLIHSFSVMVLMTDTQTLVSPNSAANLISRVAMFNAMRDNQNTFVLNKSSEDFKNVTTPLSGLHELQAQAQEHMASVHRIPLVKFTGIQPSGLNASSEGEIKVYDDTIKAYQARFMDPNLRRVINFQQLSLWGDIDPEITHRWQPLREITEAEKGQKRKDDADTMQKYVDMGAFAPEEIRRIAIEDEELPFTDLDPDDVPEPPAEEGLLGPGAGGAATEFEKENEPQNDNEPQAGQRRPPASAKGGGASDAADPFGATDEADDWREEDHPRGPDGKFGSGSGGGKASSMPGIPDFLKVAGPGKHASGERQTLKMPQFGLTHAPFADHQPFSYKPTPRKPMPKSEGKPAAPGSLVAFTPGEGHGVKAIGGVKFESYDPPDDWADVGADVDIGEPPLPELPKGLSISTGCIIREKDGRVWLLRPKDGFGGYDQTFPKGGLEDGLTGQQNAMKEVFEETGLKVKITGFAGDHEGDVTVTRFYTAERETGDPADAGWEAEGVILAPAERLKDLLNRKRDQAIASTLSPAAQPTLDPADLKKVGGKMGSNEGGTFEDKAGNRFYVKRPQSKAHVQNELAAARLYQLAGVNTLNYREVKGGNHVATDLVKLDKNNVSKLTPEERKEATRDFAVHAWLGNYDAAGTGGDNQGVLDGKVTTLDVGGSLRYRAQGAPKQGWGKKVTEIDTMRGLDPKVHAPDAAKLFGKMSEGEMAKSAERVTAIPDEAIRSAVGGDEELADILIGRKQDIAKRFSLQAADESSFEEGKHPRAPDGKFTSGAGGGHVGEEEYSDFTKKLLGEVDELVAAAHAKKHPDMYADLEQEDPALGGGGVGGGENLSEAQLQSYELFLKDVASLAKETDKAGITKLIKDNPEQWNIFKDLADPAVVGKVEKAIGSSFPSLGAKTAEGKQSAFGGLYQTSGKDPKENHLLSVKKALEGGGQGGTHYRNMLKQLILEAKGFGNEQAVPALQQKLGWAWAKASEKASAKGDAKEAQKAYEKALSFGWKGTHPGASAASAAPPPKVEAKAPAPPLQTSFGKATPQELEKAKKNVPLQMAYVPGPKPELAGGAPMKAAEQLVKQFNDKWASKGNLKPADLEQKVHDFKQLGAMVGQLAGDEKKHFAGIAAKAKEEQAKAAAAQAAKAKALAAETAKANAGMMKELGISETQAGGFVALAKMLGKTGKDLSTEFKQYEAEAKSLGYPISGFECALIKNYSDGGYRQVNIALRSGKWTPAQHVYVGMVNQALKKMPAHTSGKPYDLTRNTTLSAEEQSVYVAGHVVQEASLTSTSTGNVFSGNTQYKVTAIGKRGASIQKLSHFKGEKEVLFAAKTYFHVDKVENAGGKMVIHMTEWEDLS